MADYRKQTRPKKCQLCKEGVETIDYKDVDLLKRFTTERGKIKPRRVTGSCTHHQREIAAAIKRARVMALVPYCEANVASRNVRLNKR